MAEESNKVELLTGRIYVVKSPNTNMVYVGSTTLSLKERFDSHLSDWRTKDSKSCSTSRLIIDEGDAYIDLLEEVQVESVRELAKFEQQWLDKIPNTVNRIRAYISEKEKKDKQKIYHETHKKEHLQSFKKYYETHREKVLKQQKIYQETHREKRNDKVREKIRCEVCDCFINKSGKSQHEHTKKHIHNLEKVIPSEY